MFDVAGGVRCRGTRRTATWLQRSVERRKGSGVLQATGTTAAASMGGVSALSVISLRRNGISTTSYRVAIRDSRISTFANKLV